MVRFGAGHYADGSASSWPATSVTPLASPSFIRRRVQRSGARTTWKACRCCAAAGALAHLVPRPTALNMSEPNEGPQFQRHSVDVTPHRPAWASPWCATNRPWLGNGTLVRLFDVDARSPHTMCRKAGIMDYAKGMRGPSPVSCARPAGAGWAA